MRNNAAVRPLPPGTNLKSTKAENHQALIKANDNNELETLFWETYLDELALKYELIYQPGKTLFQIYYPAGRTNNANKQIVHEVTTRIKKINEDWAAVQATFDSFKHFSDEALAEEIKAVRTELLKLDDERSKFVESLSTKNQVDQEEVIADFLNEYGEKRKIIQIDFANNHKVKELDKIREQYEKHREKIINEYLKSTEKNFTKLLKQLEFVPQ